MCPELAHKQVGKSVPPPVGASPLKPSPIKAIMPTFKVYLGLVRSRFATLAALMGACVELI